MRPLPVADPGSPDDRSAGRYLWWLLRQGWVPVTTAIVFAVGWMVCQALVPAVIGRAVDAGVAGGSLRGVLTWSLVLLAVGVAQAATGVVRHRFAVTNYLAAAYRTVQVAVRQVGRLGSTLPRRSGAGEVVAVGTADAEHIGNAVDITARGAGSAVAVVTVTVVLLSTSVPLGLVVLLGVPLLMAVVALLVRPLHRRQRAYREQQGRLTAQAADLVAGLRVLRGVGGEDVVAAAYRRGSQALRAAGVRAAGVQALLEAAQVLLPGAFLVLVTWLGARFAVTGQITVGQLIAFYGYAAFLVAPLRQLTESVDKLTRGHVAARRVVALLRTRTDLPDPPVPVAPSGGDLVDPASGVVVRAGALTALAAADPADAAAVADRLGRYVPGADARWGGVPLSALALADVRAGVLVADAEARLFSGVLRDDLDPAGTGRTRDALAAADALDIVAGLPGGLDGEVGEGGRTLSGGQQQRLRLARALVADPPVLVLVEPTGAVDAPTEARIAARLAAARRGRTTLVCTTSPLLLDHADRVLFLRDGAVRAAGTHRELLDREPGYARAVLREQG